MFALADPAPAPSTTTREWLSTVERNPPFLREQDTLFTAMKKVAASAPAQITGPWAEVLGKFEQAGSLSGAKASATAESMMSQMQGAMRQGRAAGLKAAELMTQSYATLVSGVLIGMSDALRQAGSPPAAQPAGKTTRK